MPKKSATFLERYMAPRSLDEPDAAILESLLDRGEEGMTIFELRNHVKADIDTIERALERLKAMELIETEYVGDRVTIRPADSAQQFIMVDEDDDTLLGRFREWLPF